MFSIHKKTFPIIDCEDFVLREQEERDLEDFFNYYTDAQVNKFILTEVPQSLEMARYELNYWRNVFYTNDGIYFAIADKKTDKMIGSIGLSSKNSYNSRIELSYDLAKEFWRKGIMSRAIPHLLKYGFETFNMNRIEAFTSIYNEPSFLLLEKCGFTYEGCLKQHRYHRGQFVDVYIYSFLKEDFLKE